ncbi:MAG: hypothetical protein K6A82_01005, partial [Prevotella sp.]|nr:hypothetical protein [Prevotella sp.]
AKVTPKMQAEISNLVDDRMYTQVIGLGKCIWTSKEEADAFAGYRQHNGRDITEIPLIEIMNAILESVREQFSINAGSITLIAARQLGFTRRGTKVDQALKEALDILIADRRIIECRGMLRLPN